MDLVDRYLKSVSDAMFLMPKAQKRDILSELTESLRSDVEAKEHELGRELSDPEREAILERYGHPLLVAGRYRGDSRSVAFGRQLIGPELFPLYIAIVALNLTLSAIVIAVITFFLGSSVTFGAVLAPIFTQFAIITTIFVIADASVRRSVSAGGWRYGTANVTDPLRIPRASSIFEIAALILFLNVWIDIPSDLGWTAGSTWTDFRATFYVPMFFLIFTSLAIAFVNLFRTRWTVKRLALRTIVNVISVLMLAVKVIQHRAEAWSQAQMVMHHAPMTKVARFEAIMNAGVTWTMFVVVLAIVGQIVYDLVRLRKLSPS